MILPRHFRLLAIALLVASVPAAIQACPVCFGDPNSAMTKGTASGVWFLLGVVGFVQVGFVALFFNFWRRARQIRERKESFRLIRNSDER